MGIIPSRGGEGKRSQEQPARRIVTAGTLGGSALGLGIRVCGHRDRREGSSRARRGAPFLGTTPLVSASVSLIYRRFSIKYTSSR